MNIYKNAFLTIYGCYDCYYKDKEYVDEFKMLENCIEKHGKENKEELKKALSEIKDDYDAYYFENKYGEGTHRKQFDMLWEFIGGLES